MKSLRISFNTKQKNNPEKIVTIPFSAIHVAVKLLPKDVKSTLEREEIDVLQCIGLADEKNLIGTLIEIENPSSRISISTA